jgi:hypothetical protein
MLPNGLFFWIVFNLSFQPSDVVPYTDPTPEYNTAGIPNWIDTSLPPHDLHVEGSRRAAILRISVVTVSQSLHL